MTELRSASRSRAAEAWVALFAFGTAALISWARIAFNDEFTPGALANVAGLDPRGGATPFQYRVLVPKLVRFVHEHVVPSLTPLAIFRVLDVLFVVAAFYALRRLARELFASEGAALSSAITFLALLPFHFVFSREYPFWYAWDMAAIAVFTYGLWLLRRREWLVFYPLFALGTFNRETTCFLTFAYVLTSWRSEPKARLVAHVAAQTLVWFAVKLLLWQLFHRARGNDVFQPAWQENLESLADPAMYRWYLCAFGGTWIPLLFALRFIREAWVRSLLHVCVPFAVGMFFAGVWTELRIWGELVPVVALALVAAWRGWRARAATMAGSAASA